MAGATSDDAGDRLAILELLARYTRGVDRADLDQLNALWADGAIVDYGDGPNDARTWAAGLVAALRRHFLRTQHMLGQSIIDLHGDTAEAETWCQAYHEMETPDGRIEIIVGGRYLDRLVRTADGWRIAHRRYVLDWNQNGPSTANWTDGLYAALKRHGARVPDDPLYTGA